MRHRTRQGQSRLIAEAWGGTAEIPARNGQRRTSALSKCGGSVNAETSRSERGEIERLVKFICVNYRRLEKLYAEAGPVMAREIEKSS